MDSIDRKTAIENMARAIWNYPNELYPTLNCYENAKALAEYGLRDVPAVEPETIRCRDCKYWTHIKRTNRYWCKTDDGLFDLNPSPDDFCSRAERRTDE